MAGVSLLVLGWRLGAQAFGFDIRSVVHIEEDLSVHRLPRPRRGVAGITYYQDSVIPVLDLPVLLLNESEHKWPPGAVYLLVECARQQYACRVDAILRVFTVPSDHLMLWEVPPDHPAVPFVRALWPREQEMLWLTDIRRIARHVQAPLSTPAHAPRSVRQGV